uniref:Uncharacterized protein n=1 Tax=Meloidogyne enterolobii TaxID=390850 RepID=A0A6V7WN22_MELEN|nr:unnamed protein product [Meloidogyne enterolobii]
MSSGPIRQMIGPTIKFIKNTINESHNIITAQQEILEDPQINRLRTLRKQLSSSIVRLDSLNREWLGFMRQIDPENLVAEERIYDNFQRPGENDPQVGAYKHFTEWVIEAQAMVDTIDDIIERDTNSSNHQSRARSRSASLHSGRSQNSQGLHAQETRNPAYDSFKIAPMEIPKFFGEQEKWTSFWQCFELAIHNNPNIPDALKIHHLCNSRYFMDMSPPLLF